MGRRPASSRVQPRLRVLRDDVVALGPGKADLLDAIRRGGSISEAARELGMSYMRAWDLVQTMNEAFSPPVVITARGGAARGGASLSEAGEEILALYREMEEASLLASSTVWRRLRRYLRP